jgi:molybdate transport system regulatory protein
VNVASAGKRLNLSPLGSETASSIQRGAGNVRGDTLRPVARLTVRIDLTKHGSIGPGKIRLLELIGAAGSISAAGRAMNMSYRRAWTLIDSLNRLFKLPVVTAQPGGTRGGGAALTRFGHEVIALYRSIERGATKASASELSALETARAPRSPVARARRTTPISRHRSPLMPRRASRGA